MPLIISTLDFLTWGSEDPPGFPIQLCPAEGRTLDTGHSLHLPADPEFQNARYETEGRLAPICLPLTLWDSGISCVVARSILMLSRERR